MPQLRRDRIYQIGEMTCPVSGTKNKQTKKHDEVLYILNPPFRFLKGVNQNKYKMEKSSKK